MTPDSLKAWLIEVLWKKAGPSLIRGAIAGLVGLVVAHQGILASMGITFDPTQNTINLDLDNLGTYSVLAGTGIITALLALFQHHTVAAVVGAPQSGDLRANPPQPVIGGARPGDLPR